VLLLLVEDLRRKRAAAEAGVIRGLARQHDDVLLLLGLRGHAGVDDVLLRHEAESDDVHQTVVIERLSEVDVAGQAGHAQGVTVLPDALDDAVHDPLGAIGIGPDRVTETQWVCRGDDPRTHAVHIPHDAADARGRALVGQNLRRVVVALMGHDDAVALALVHGEFHDPGVLLGPQDHIGAIRGEELLERRATALVRAVLRPLGAEHVHLGEGGIAAQEIGDLVGLINGQADACLAHEGRKPRGIGSGDGETSFVEIHHQPSFGNCRCLRMRAELPIGVCAP